jgi:hypothetical protein
MRDVGAKNEYGFHLCLQGFSAAPKRPGITLAVNWLKKKRPCGGWQQASAMAAIFLLKKRVERAGPTA